MPTEEQLKKLWDVCAKWRDSHKPLCAESIYQRDSIQEALPELGEAVCDVIGYAEAEED